MYINFWHQAAEQSWCWYISLTRRTVPNNLGEWPAKGNSKIAQPSHHTPSRRVKVKLVHPGIKANEDHPAEWSLNWKKVKQSEKNSGERAGMDHLGMASSREPVHTFQKIRSSPKMHCESEGRSWNLLTCFPFALGMTMVMCYLSVADYNNPHELTWADLHTEEQRPMTLPTSVSLHLLYSALVCSHYCNLAQILFY